MSNFSLVENRIQEEEEEEEKCLNSAKIILKMIDTDRKLVQLVYECRTTEHKNAEGCLYVKSTNIVFFFFLFYLAKFSQS